MARKIFVEFPVRDLDAARSFYLALGFRLNTSLSMEERALIEVADNIALVLLSEARFARFVKGKVVNARQGSQYLLCFSAESREEVDGYYAKAIAAGGSPWLETSDHDNIYCRSFTDLDGHVLEVVYVRNFV